VQADGALRVRTTHGTVVAVTSGEVTGIDASSGNRTL